MDDLDKAIKAVTDSIENLNNIIEEKNLAIEDISTNECFQQLRGPMGVPGPAGPGLTNYWLIQTLEEMSSEEIHQIRKILLVD